MIVGCHARGHKTKQEGATQRTSDPRHCDAPVDEGHARPRPIGTQPWHRIVNSRRSRSFRVESAAVATRNML